MGWTIGLPSLKLNNVGQKSKHCGSFTGVVMEALEERKGRDPDINPERSHLNIYEGYKTAAELIEYSRQHVAELSEQQQAAGKRKIREDAVVMCSTIVKPPAEMMLAMSQEDQMRFLRDAADGLENIIGKNNIKSKAFHYDEQGAHVHVLWEPMTPDGRLCAKEVHNLKFFHRLNQEMPQHLRSKGWDIDDCQAYDAAIEELKDNQKRNEQKRKNGRSSAVYKRDMEVRAAFIQDKLEELIDRYDQLAVEHNDLLVTLDEKEEEIERLTAAALPPEEIQSIVDRSEESWTGSYMKVKKDDFETLIEYCNAQNALRAKLEKAQETIEKLKEQLNKIKAELREKALEMERMIRYYRHYDVFETFFELIMTVVNDGYMSERDIEEISRRIEKNGIYMRMDWALQQQLDETLGTDFARQDKERYYKNQAEKKKSDNGR